MIPKIKSYKTEWETETKSKYEMLADMLDADAEEMSPRSPRILQCVEQSWHGYHYLIAIIVWEQR